MIDREHALPVTKQSKLLGLSRSSVYYQRKPMSDQDLQVMRAIDQIYMDTPYYGSRKIRVALKTRGYAVGRQHVRRLMRLMGIEAMYQKPRLSIANREHTIYPYLLRNLDITRANQVWCSDITYIPTPKGFCYLVAVMDWASRRVLSWRLSNTMDSTFCCEALQEAIQRYGRPEIFNTDQGSQFTSMDFTDILKEHGIRISMDGKGRWMDNVFIERLWRSLKYEEVHPKAHGTMIELRQGIANYMEKYNHLRPHQALDYKTPDEVYWTILPHERAA
jgi:putative transposase